MSMLHIYIACSCCKIIISEQFLNINRKLLPSNHYCSKNICSTYEDVLNNFRCSTRVTDQDLIGHNNYDVHPLLLTRGELVHMRVDHACNVQQCSCDVQHFLLFQLSNEIIIALRLIQCNNSGTQLMSKNTFITELSNLRYRLCLIASLCF